jgi:hypothetical protein
MCGSKNFKCYEFENECIIMKCKDCGRFEINNTNNLGIEMWSKHGELYFCSYGGGSPHYVYQDNEVIRTKGFKLFFGRTKDEVKRRVYDYPRKEVEAQYEYKIKQLKKQLDEVMKKYEKFKENK